MSDVIRIARQGWVNCYLVDEDDGFTLIDTTMTGAGRALRERADAHGKPIVRILLTHAHGDHVGAVDELAKDLSDAEVLISTRDARFLSGDKSLDPGEDKGKLRGGYVEISTAPTRTLEPGDRVGSLECIAAPGHTPGQLALLDTRDRTLYCGDAFTTFGGVTTTAKLHLPFPFAAMATWHRQTAVETARALRALDPERLAPGHGKVVESPGAAMDKAIARDSGVRD